MFYLRVVSNQNHFARDSFNLPGAQKSLTDRAGGNPSVYRVPDGSYAIRVATIYSMATKDRPEQLSYILIPEAVVSQLMLVAVPDIGDIDYPVMKSTHHEIHGIHNPEILQQLAEAIRDHPNSICMRLKDREILAQTRIELADDSTKDTSAVLIEGKIGWTRNFS